MMEDGKRDRCIAVPGFCAVLLASACVFLAIAGCRKPVDSGTEISMTAHLDPQPVRIGQENIIIRLTDSSARPVSQAKIQIEADMSHPGMSPVFADAREQDAGSYLATLNFNMAGDWVVLAHIKLPGGKKLERQVSVPGVRSN